MPKASSEPASPDNPTQIVLATDDGTENDGVGVLASERLPRDAPPALPDRAGSAIDALLTEPSPFSFDAAIALLMRAARRGTPGDAIRFRAALGLGFTPCDVSASARTPAGFAMETGIIGLTGPSGVLPRPYTEMVNDEHRRRSGALSAFLDLLAQRPIAQFAAAAIKYRPHRAADAAAIAQSGADGMRDILLALVGYTDETLRARLWSGIEPLLYYSGVFAARPRSADRLAAVLSDWFGQKVEIEQFSGSWLPIAKDQRSALSAGKNGRFSRLGVDAVAGAWAWDIQSRIALRIGPLELERFEALMPNGELLHRVAAFTRAYLGMEIDFVINPILAAHAVPAPALAGSGSPSMLGWTCWLPVSGGRRDDAEEAKFRSLGTPPRSRSTNGRPPDSHAGGRDR